MGPNSATRRLAESAPLMCGTLVGKLSLYGLKRHFEYCKPVAIDSSRIQITRARITGKTVKRIIRLIETDKRMYVPYHWLM